MDNAADIISWYWECIKRWPNYFSIEIAQKHINWSFELIKSDQENLEDLLKIALLRMLYCTVKDCTKCNRYTQRPYKIPVMDDCSYDLDIFTRFDKKTIPIGAYRSKVMLIGEGPGEYEQRSGNPFVGWQSLKGSNCALRCSNFEGCYTFNNDNWKPGMDCVPCSLKRSLPVYSENFKTIYPQLIELDNGISDNDIIRERAKLPKRSLNTCGEVLDRIFLSKKDGQRLIPELWRESWNPARVRNNSSAPVKHGTIYITNALKCGNLTPTEDESNSCNDYLNVQIYIIQPKVIVTLGKYALASVTNESLDSIKTTSPTVKGVIRKSRQDIPVIPYAHPSWAMRNKKEIFDQYVTDLIKGFQRAYRIANGEEIVKFETNKTLDLDEKPATIQIIHLAGLPELDPLLNPSVLAEDTTTLPAELTS